MKVQEQYMGLCYSDTMLDAYDVSNFDFDSDPGSRGNKRVKRMCHDCPIVAACYMDGVNFAKRGLEISGVYGGYNAGAITKQVERDRRETGVVEEVRANLRRKQIINIAIWDTLRELNLVNSVG